MIKVLMTGPDLKVLSGGIQTHIEIFLEAYSGSKVISIEHFAVTEGKYDREGWWAKLKRFWFKKTDERGFSKICQGIKS